MRNQQGQFVVRYPGGYAVRFVTNACQQAYALVPDEEATLFADEEIANITARNYGMRVGQYVVEPLKTETK